MLINEDYNIKTPCYVINKKVFLENFITMRNSFLSEWGDNLLLGYSIKTNHVPVFLEMAKEENMVAEAVSEDEYYYAIRSGYKKNKIILNGPDKSETCLIDALENNSIVNIDNDGEISIIEKNRSRLSNSDIKVGLRINFDLEKICAGETTAGIEGSRFGISIENNDFKKAIDRLRDLSIGINGLHLHYSTKSRSLKVFKTLAEKACEVCREYDLLEDIEYIDLGGGFWGGRVLEGKPKFSEYSNTIVTILKSTFDPRRVQLILEPGAALLATAAKYYTRVKNIRMIHDTLFVTVDGSLLDINPFKKVRIPEYKLYPSAQEIVPKQIICGATCMEDDRILYLENEAMFKIGDYIQIDNVGAYTMSLNNCFIHFPPYIYLKEKNDIRLVRTKEENMMFHI